MRKRPVVGCVFSARKSDSEGFDAEVKASLERLAGGEWGLRHNLSENANDHAVMVLHRGG